MRTKLTNIIQDQITTAVRAGNYLTVAGQHAGVPEDTLTDWIARGTPGTVAYTERGPWSQEEDKTSVAPEDGRFGRFARAIAQARADAEVHAVGVLRQAMVGDLRTGVPADWRAAVEYLKRAHPTRWRDEMRVEATHGGRVEHAVRVAADDEQLLGVLAALEEAGVHLAPEAPHENGRANGAAAQNG